ncbi:MAG: chromosome partitioning protein ParB [Fimbriimonadales bacterium]
MFGNRLGKGLSELVSEAAGRDSVHELPVEHVLPNPLQPRRSFDEAMLRELADTIREQGILQPLVVRQVGHDRYELIAGERRLRAAKMAGLARVPAVIRAADDRQMLELALVENLQREDVNPADAALAYRKLSTDFGLTQEQIAARVGKSRGVIANTLRLLSLPAPMFESVRRGEITEGHARAILALDDEGLQRELHRQIVDEGLSVREAERRSRFFRRPPDVAVVEPVSVPPEDPNWLRIEESLSERIGARVQIVRVGSGGRIQIPFYDQEDLSRILEVFGILG